MHHKISCMHLFFLTIFLLCHTGPSTCHSMSSLPLLMLAFKVACILLWSLVKTYLGNLIYPEMAEALLLDFGGGISVRAWTFLASGHTPYCEITLPKNGMLVHLKRHLSLLSFKFTCLYTRVVGMMFHHGLCPAHKSLQLKCHQ